MASDKPEVILPASFPPAFEGTAEQTFGLPDLHEDDIEQASPLYFLV